jgi:hypothetical protein
MDIITATVGGVIRQSIVQLNDESTCKFPSRRVTNSQEAVICYIARKLYINPALHPSWYIYRLGASS